MCYTVRPYDYTVAEFTNRISYLKNRLAKRDIKDEGISVPVQLGVENRMTSNSVLFVDYDSLSYSKTPKEILRVLYTTRDERVPDGFYPLGTNGAIASRRCTRKKTTRVSSSHSVSPL